MSRSDDQQWWPVSIVQQVQQSGLYQKLESTPRQSAKKLCQLAAMPWKLAVPSPLERENDALKTVILLPEARIGK
jgi:hypothetical protein